MEITVTEN